MVFHTLVLLALLTLPLVAGVGLVVFMARGKGKPAPTQDEIMKFREEKKARDTEGTLSNGDQ